MSPKQNSNPFSLWAAGFVVVTAVLALAIERFRDVTFGRALVTAAILVVGIAVLTLAIIGIRRERSSRKRDRNVENDEADSSLADDSPPSDSESEEQGNLVDDLTSVDTDETATNMPAIRQTPSAVQPGRLPSTSDVPESIADLASYSELLHPWSFYRHVVAASFLGIFTVILFAWLSVNEGPWADVFTVGPWLLFGLWLLWLLGFGFAVLMLIRRHKMWTMRPLVCDPRSGILTIFETGSRLWVIPNSEPDQYPLSEVSIDSPKQTLFEQYVLRDSYTLVLMGEGKPRVIRYVRDIRKVKDIASAYRSIVTQQRDLLREILGEVRLQQLEQQRTNQLLEQLLTVNQRIEHTVTQLPRS